MDIATQTTATTTLETFVSQIVREVVERIDYGQLKERKLAYTPEEVAELVGFTNALAVVREASAGRLIGSKVRGSWRFTEEQIRDYLREHEVPI
jgi:hypothetical protein